MYKVRSELTRAMAPMTQNQQPPLPPQQFVNPSTEPIQQPLDSANTSMLWSKGINDGSSFRSGPVDQGPRMAPNQQLPLEQQYLPPIGRNRQKTKGSRKAGHPYRNHNKHESSGTVFYDHSTGIDPGHAQIDANNHPGIGKVWRTPPKNPLMTDCNLT